MDNFALKGEHTMLSLYGITKISIIINHGIQIVVLHREKIKVVFKVFKLPGKT